MKHKVLKPMDFPMLTQIPVVDVAVTKHHQRLNQTMIIFTRTSSKSCFQKNFVMQSTPSILNAIQFAQHTLIRLL